LTIENSNKKPLLGIIGGMGVQATSYFYDKLHSMQNVSSEQEYIDTLIYSIPSTPDRTNFITGKSKESPLNSLLRAVKTLESANASLIVMPCITAHYFHNELATSTNIPVLNLPSIVASNVMRSGIKKVELFATDGTLKSRVFHSAFEKTDVELITPSPAMQSTVMEIIYEIKKSGKLNSYARECIQRLCISSSADKIILGCTELCIFGEIPKTFNVLDSLVVAAKDFMANL